MDATLTDLTRDKIASKPLAIGYATHSPLMRATHNPLTAHLSKITPRAPTIDLFSTITDEQLATAPSTAHWLDHLTSPVRFARAVEATADAKFDVFVEVAATAALSP